MSWAPDYTSLTLVKQYLQIGDDDDDALLPMWITTASRAVDNFCGRQFGTVDAAEDRTYDTRPDRASGRWLADIDDLHSADGLTVTVGGNTVDASTVTLWPRNAPALGRPFERITLARAGAVTLNSDSFGWAAVPAAASTAALLQTARLSQRRFSPYGVAGSPQQGSEVRLLASLDPDLKTSLDAFRRQWWAA